MRGVPYSAEPPRTPRGHAQLKVAACGQFGTTDHDSSRGLGAVIREMVVYKRQIVCSAHQPIESVIKRCSGRAACFSHMRPDFFKSRSKTRSARCISLVEQQSFLSLLVFSSVQPRDTRPFSWLFRELSKTRTPCVLTDRKRFWKKTYAESNFCKSAGDVFARLSRCVAHHCWSR